MRSSLVAAAALITPAAVPAADSGIFKACTIDTVTICTPAGCGPRKPSISIFVSDYMDGVTERGAYYRCGLHLVRCNRYSAVVYRSGDFITFSLPARSVFAKLGPGNIITDIAAVEDSVFISRGRCANRAPPAGSAERSH
jgi:hypothetical protein